MPPQEKTPLLASGGGTSEDLPSLSGLPSFATTPLWKQPRTWVGLAVVVAAAAAACLCIPRIGNNGHGSNYSYSVEALTKATGPYKIVNVHQGKDFFDGFTFYEGADSLGSAGYLTYQTREESLSSDYSKNLANVTTEEGVRDPFDPSAPAWQQSPRDFVYLSSRATAEGPRDSVRLEGRTRYHRGLFVLDLRHLPTGCGVWPAFWLTDETMWPNHGEIDVRNCIVIDGTHMYIYIHMYARLNQYG